MYTRRITFFPALGKGPELRTILEERVRLAQSHGTRANLQAAVFGAEGPTFSIGNQFDDLGALDALLANPLPVDSRIAPLTRQPVRTELYEVLLAAPAAMSPARYIQRVTGTPLSGKGPESLALTLESAKARQADGIRTNVQIQVAGPAAGSVVTNIIFTNLAELEKLRARNQTDTAFQQYLTKVQALSARPPQIEVFENLVAFQPR